MLDQVKTEIVLPYLGAFTRDQSRDTLRRRWLPDDEVCLVGQFGSVEIRLPVDARSLAAKVGAFPRIVLFEDIGSVGVGREGLCNSDFERKNLSRPVLRVCQASQFQNRGDMCLVLRPQL